MGLQQQLAGSRSDLCILLIEDDDLDAYITTLALRGLNQSVRVVRASGGKEAIAMLAAKEVSPDLAIVDLHMPGVGGQQLLAIFSEDSSTKTIPLIVLTTHSDWEDAIYSQVNGASHIVTICCDHAELGRALQGAIDQAADQSLLALHQLGAAA